MQRSLLSPTLRRRRETSAPPAKSEKPDSLIIIATEE